VAKQQVACSKQKNNAYLYLPLLLQSSYTLLENCPHFFDTLPLLVWADVKKRKKEKYQNGDNRNRVVIT